MTLFITTFLIIAVVVALMAVGVIFGRRAIKGNGRDFRAGGFQYHGCSPQLNGDFN